jgi:hypothetical protein
MGGAAATISPASPSICGAAASIDFATIPIYFAAIPLRYSDSFTSFSAFPVSEAAFYQTGVKKPSAISFQPSAGRRKTVELKACLRLERGLKSEKVREKSSSEKSRSSVVK